MVSCPLPSHPILFRPIPSRPDKLVESVVGALARRPICTLTSPTASSPAYRVAAGCNLPRLVKASSVESGDSLIHPWGGRVFRLVQFDSDFDMIVHHDDDGD